MVQGNYSHLLAQRRRNTNMTVQEKEEKRLKDHINYKKRKQLKIIEQVKNNATHNRSKASK